MRGRRGYRADDKPGKKDSRADGKVRGSGKRDGKDM